MNTYNRNSELQNEMLPVDVVFHPSWWHRNEGIVFDEDFYFNPQKRVEVENQMERALYERWGKYGLGLDRDKSQPIVGAVHLAAGFLVSEMLGCKVEYVEDSAPRVIPANLERPEINTDAVFQSSAFKKFDALREALKAKYGYLKGDVNWGGILNIAMDLRGHSVFLDMFDVPETLKKFFSEIAGVIEKFTVGIKRESGTTSISVNRNVRHFPSGIYLHSECAHTMISLDYYADFLFAFDAKWSEKYRPYGIHYCGEDPHRYAEVFSSLPHLDFLDVGWGGDVKLLRQHLPETFLNIRLSPVDIIDQSAEQIESDITRLVQESDNPWLTGVCCINMDHHVTDDKVTTILETAGALRKEYSAESPV